MHKERAATIRMSAGDTRGEDGFRFRNTGHLRQTLPPEPLADFGESRALGVRKPQSSGDVGAKDSILRNQILALEEKPLIDQASHVRL